MKLHKFALLAVVALGSFLMSACTADTETDQKKSTLFGLYTYEPACYAVSDADAAVVRTDDVVGMELPSGDRLQLFWGLISIEDY